MFGNDYRWKPITDPTDDPTLQVDAVSKDSGLSGAFGSPWPIVASTLADQLHCPIAIIQTALGGTASFAWQPGLNPYDRSTLFGSMLFRSIAGVRAILVHQGESDALNLTSQTVYNARLNTFANTVHAQLGVKVLWARLQNSAGALDFAEDTINAAINDAIANNSNVLAGPDLRIYHSEDEFHFRTNVAINNLAQAWVGSINSAAAAEGWW